MDDLPPQMSSFQAIEIDSDNFVFDLLSRLAKHLGFEKFPRVDQSAMMHELISATSAVSGG